MHFTVALVGAVRLVDRGKDMGNNKMLAVRNAVRAIDESPLLAVCRVGLLPSSASHGLDVDWGEAGFCTVSQMAAVAAIQLAGSNAHIRQQYTLPKTDTCSYMMRMDYCKVLGIEVEEGFVRHRADGRFVPLTAIPIDEMSADPGGTADLLTEVVSKNAGFNASTSDSLGMSFCEVIDNIVQHSEAPAPGIAGAQWFPSMGYVETCVADCGIGIAQSMATNAIYGGLSDDELLEKAFEYETGQWYGKSCYGSKEVSGGIGLSYSANLVRAVGGHLWAVSHSSAVHISSAGITKLDGLYYPGTVISMKIPKTDREVLESDLFPDGENLPIRYEPGEGIYTEQCNDLLW